MTIADSSSLDSLPLELARQIDALARRAERAWREAAPIPIEDLLREVPRAGQSVLLEELLRLELEALTRQQSPLPIDEWRQRFPDDDEILRRVLADLPQAQSALPAVPGSPPSQFPQIPGYTFLRQLGRGAMGVVYLARQERLQRLVALKVVGGGAEMQQAMAKLRTEAEVIARFQHPNIVQIYEVGENHHGPFLAIEFVDGESLQDRLSRGPLAPREAAELLEQLARTVHHAHIHGVIHRDLKPANILLPKLPEGPPRDNAVPPKLDQRPSSVKISDFGLAKVLDARHEQTQSGSILGTPKYMAPEQAEGRTREVGPATDVYALGAIFFEMLTGEVPFAADSTLKLLRLISEREAKFSEPHRRNLAADLQSICLRCLEKNPAARYTSALALADDLRRFLNGFPVTARRPSQLDLFRKFVRRNRVLSISVAAVFLTLIAGSIAVSFFAIRELKARRHAEILAHQEGLARSQVQALRLEERNNVYWANLQLAQQAYHDGRLDQMQELLSRVVPERPEDQDLRGFEWHYLQRLSVPRSQVIPAGSYEGRIAFSPDGRSLATPSTDGSITLWDSATAKPQKHFRGHTNYVTDVTYNQDGTLLASASRDHTIRIWQLNSIAEPTILKEHQYPVRSVVFSPDGRRLASADETDTVIVWDTAQGTVVWRHTQPNLFAMDIDYSPDGTLLAVGSGEGNVLLFQAEAGELVEKFFTDHRFWLTGIAFDPSGGRLATCGGDKLAKVWNLNDLTQPTKLTGHSDWLTGVTFRDDGETIATSSRDGTVKLWNSRTGENQTTLKGHSHWVMTTAFARSDQRVASGALDGTVRIWNPDLDWEVRKLEVTSVTVTCLAVIDQGRRLVIACGDGTLKIVDVATGETVKSLPAHPAFVSSLAVSVDGKTLATGSHDRTIRIWDVDTWQERQLITNAAAELHHLALSPHERQLASVDREGTVRIWNCGTGAEMFQLPQRQLTPSAIAYSPDGRLLAMCGMATGVELWDTARWTPVRQLSGHVRLVDSIAFSQDGQRIATGGTDQTIRIWDSSSGEQLQVLKGHNNGITSLVFSRDGRRLLSGSYDGTVRLWDPHSGRELLTNRYHSDWVNCVALNPAEDIIFSGGNDRTVRLLELRRPK